MAAVAQPPDRTTDDAAMISDEDWMDRARARLVREIAEEARDTEAWTGRPAFSPAVMAAMAAVPRHAFVPPELVPAAYVNRPQSIGHGQTISQPYIVALMTDLLDLAAGDRVLEVGTGCGYQTAVLARLADHVYSLEVVDELARTAAARLKGLGIGNITLRRGDGFAGWAEHAPYDAVIVTAAPEKVPAALVAQLKVAGRMVIPVGQVRFGQTLLRGVKGADGRLETETVLPVAFVPMVREVFRRG